MTRRAGDVPEDPAVAAVEGILEAVSNRASPGATVTRRDGRVVTSHAVWLCACESFDDSPTWLLYAVGDDGVGWERIREGPGVDVPDVVEAEHLTGCHPAPSGVLAWLRGQQRRPWPGTRSGDFPDDAYVYDEIIRRVREASTH